ncbi:BTAD domain-containing putative transcriptional regulator [Kitasatospora sp. LaBMicrA B282]|uniref:BTAD domain-containing putative transcriptional regulator n=1 Tax=Kitasatospora sp. LaBMicrA B282 TaxID=3420949 RepID=UPI003D147615
MTPHVGRIAAFLRAAAAGAALLGLLAGLPYALLVWAAPFRPRHVPDLAEVTIWAANPLSAVLLLQILYCLCWLLWTYLVLQTLREVLWQAANFPTLSHGAGPNLLALTARRTIAGLLVGTIALAIATSLRTTPAARTSTTLAAWTAPVVATAPAVPVAAPITDQAPKASAGPAAQPAASCTVQLGDTLWDLAERHLDNPLRWREIYALNKQRLQADGTRLSDPDRITPGWTFLLPSGPPATPSPAPPAPVQAPPSTTQAPAPAPTPAGRPARPTPAQAPHTAGQTSQSDRPTVVPQHSRATGVQLPSGAGYLALTVAATLSAAAVRRTLLRRRDFQLDDVTSANEPRPEETSLVAAMRGISRHQQDLAATSVPPGAETPDVPVGARGTKEQGLLDLLTKHDHRMLALAGPGAEDAARALLVSALTATARVLLPRTELARLAPGLPDSRLHHCRLVPDTEAAISALEDEHLHRARQHHEGTGPADQADPQLLILLTGYEPRHHQRLRTLVEVGRADGLAAVVLTDAAVPPADALVYYVASDGSATATSTHEPDSLRLFHVPTATADILLALLPQADEQVPDPRQPVEASPLTEAPELGDSSLIEAKESSVPNSEDDKGDTSEGIRETEKLGTLSESDASPGAPSSPSSEQSSPRKIPPVPSDDVPARRPVSISLLGPLATTVRGELITRGLTGYAGELLAYLATRPTGSTKDAVLEAIWPEKELATTGTEAFHTAKKSIRGALRTALGATTSAPVLLQAGGLWRLDPALVETDLEQFHAVARRAATTTDPAERTAAHRRTVELYHGELCQGLDRPWLTAPREDTRRRVLNALGALAASASDPEEALGLLERALDHDPYNEQLHLRLARQHTALGRSEAVRRTQERLRTKLAEIDERPTPAATRAFQDLLVPTPSQPIPSRAGVQRPYPVAGNRAVRPGTGAPVPR